MTPPLPPSRELDNNKQLAWSGFVLQGTGPRRIKESDLSKARGGPTQARTHRWRPSAFSTANPKYTVPTRRLRRRLPQKAHAPTHTVVPNLRPSSKRCAQDQSPNGSAAEPRSQTWLDHAGRAEASSAPRKTQCPPAQNVQMGHMSCIPREASESGSCWLRLRTRGGAKIAALSVGVVP
jgi:hypothetical protein